MKKAISMILALALLIGMLPAWQTTAQAAPAHSGICGDSVAWTLDDTGVLTISGSGAMTDYSRGADVPWFELRDAVTKVVIEDGITYIGRVCFFFLENVTEVSIPDSVTAIGESAFSSCAKLAKIEIPDSVTTIGNTAFQSCSALVSVSIPGSVTQIGDAAFHSCSALTEVVLPDSVTELGRGAFGLCENLTSITLPAGIKTIRKNTFFECVKLKDVYYAGYEIQWNAVNIWDGNEYLTAASIHFADETQNGTSGNVQAEQGYLGAVSEAIEDIRTLGWGRGYGSLYDIDENGVDELILVYSAAMERNDGYSVPVKVCSAYTLLDGTAVALFEKETLFIEAGGPSGGAAVIQNGTKCYLAVTSESGEMDNWGGSWKLYEIQGASAELDTHITYEEHYDLEGEIVSSSASKNGEPWSYEAYEAWEKDLQVLLMIDPYENESALALEDLYAYLKEHPVEDAAASEAALRAEWIRQHMEYAASKEYETEIVAGFDNRLLAVFRDARNDADIKWYEARKVASKILDMDMEFTEAEVYELILAELLYGNTGLGITGESFAQTQQNTVENTMRVLVEIAKTAKNAKEIPQDVYDSINDLYDVIQTLEYGSSEYSGAYSKLVALIDGNVKDWKSELTGDAAFLGMEIAFDAVFEEFDAAEDILTYINNYIAFRSMSQQTREVLEDMELLMLSKYEAWNYPQQVLDELGDIDTIANWTDFQIALESMITTIVQYEEDGAIAVARYAVECEREAADQWGEDALKKVAIFAMEKAASYVPVLGTILAGKNIISAGLSASIILDQIFTNIDEMEGAVGILVKTFCISVLLDQTVDRFALGMAEDDFFSTTVFDEAVSIYRKNQLLAVRFASEYTGMVLSNRLAALSELEEQEKTYGWTDENEKAFYEEVRKALQDDIRWYSNHKKGLSEQQIEMEAIACHDSELSYDWKQNEVPSGYAPSGLYIVACPVDVRVLTDQGEQVAYLCGGEDQVAEGYEFYFHTIKAADSTGEYIKVAIIPDGYQLELLGADDGVMHAFSTAFGEDDSAEVYTYFNIPVSAGSVGYMEVCGTDASESRLQMDQIEYANMDSAEDLPRNRSGDSIWVWIAGGAVALLLAWRLIHRKKRGC